MGKIMSKINKLKSGDNVKICELCKKEMAIVKVTFMKDSLFGGSEPMNLCANCRDNLDDDIRIEEY